MCASAQHSPPKTNMRVDVVRGGEPTPLSFDVRHSTQICELLCGIGMSRCILSWRLWLVHSGRVLSRDASFWSSFVLVRDLQVFGEALVSPRLEILQAVIRKMWAQASLADIQPVRCCNRTVATGPRGLDQRAWKNGVFRWSIFFLVVYFMYLLCL